MFSLRHTAAFRSAVLLLWAAVTCACGKTLTQEEPCELRLRAAASASTKADPELAGASLGTDNAYVILASASTTGEPDKSIYDPCPPGWRVPVKDTWTEFTTSGCTEWFSSPAGRSYYPAGDAGKGRIWYPAGGYRYNHAANWDKVRTVGYSWSDSPQTENDALATHGVSFIFSQSEVMTGGSPRHCGLPVRYVRLR